MAAFSFDAAADVKTFGDKIKLSKDGMLKSMVLSLLGDGVIDFEGYVLPHKVGKEDRRKLWKYIQYLWLANPDNEALVGLGKKKEVGAGEGVAEADARSFVAGVRTALGLGAGDEISVDDLVRFINEVAIASGLVHPVLQELHKSIRKRAPRLEFEPVFGIVNEVGQFVQLGDPTLERDEEGHVLRVKLT